MALRDAAVRSARFAAIVAEDYAYATRRNVVGLLDRRTPEEYLAGRRAPIVAIPGIYEAWRFLGPVTDAVHDAGHPVHVMPELRRNTDLIRDAAAQVARLIHDRDLRGAILLGHSKGGIVGKYAMLRLDPAARIGRMVAICSPFAGSGMARYALTPRLRVFSPTSTMTEGLGAYRDVNARITSIYSRVDPHIPEGGELPGATNIRLPVDGHFRILADPLLITTVLEAIGGPDAPVSRP